MAAAPPDDEKGAPLLSWPLFQVRKSVNFVAVASVARISVHLARWRRRRRPGGRREARLGPTEREIRASHLHFRAPSAERKSRLAPSLGVHLAEPESSDWPEVGAACQQSRWQSDKSRAFRPTLWADQSRPARTKQPRRPLNHRARPPPAKGRQLDANDDDDDDDVNWNCQAN